MRTIGKQERKHAVQQGSRSVAAVRVEAGQQVPLKELSRHPDVARCRAGDEVGISKRRMHWYRLSDSVGFRVTG